MLELDRFRKTNRRREQAITTAFYIKESRNQGGERKRRKGTVSTHPYIIHLHLICFRCEINHLVLPLYQVFPFHSWTSHPKKDSKKPSRSLDIPPNVPCKYFGKKKKGFAVNKSLQCVMRSPYSGGGGQKSKDWLNWQSSVTRRAVAAPWWDGWMSSLTK